MSEEYQTVERNREEGSIGIGAMIVFIALILVAAVASTIIIKTAEELQQNAESTSDDTRKEISGKVNIIQIIVNGSSGNDIDSLIVTAKIASGSTDVQVQDIEWVIVCWRIEWIRPDNRQPRDNRPSRRAETAADLRASMRTDSMVPTTRQQTSSRLEPHSSSTSTWTNLQTLMVTGPSMTTMPATETIPWMPMRAPATHLPEWARPSSSR